MRTKFVSIGKPAEYAKNLKKGDYVEIEGELRSTEYDAEVGEGKKKTTVKRRMVAIRIPVYPNHTFRSIRISQQALPILTQEALHAQSAKVDILSGATYTSQGFVGSLSDALTRARGW